MGKTDPAKVKFIQEHFPDYRFRNPYMDLRWIREVKQGLIHYGFYNKYDSMVCDTHIINLVVIAQGKKPYRRSIERREKKVGMQYV